MAQTNYLSSGMQEAPEIKSGFAAINSARHYLIMLVLPLLVFLLGLMQLRQYPVTHTQSSDPAYAYLMNGLTLAQGSSDIGHTDNPGTTVQVFAAVVIRAVYLFRSAPSLTDDVIANPETYITACRVAMFVLNTLLIFWLGMFTWKKSGGKWAATLLMQCILFFSQYLVIYFTALMPEGLLITGGIIMSGICVHLLYNENLTPGVKLKYAAAFGVATAFMMVSKFPAVAVCAIPLVMLAGNRYKAAYLGFTFIAVLIFVFPAREKIGDFFHFIFGILTHKGKYGSGEEGFASKAEFWNNCFTHLYHSRTYFIIIGLSVLMILAGFIRFKKWMEPHQLKFRLLAGVSVAALLNLAMASKAFAYHYLISVQIFSAVALLALALLCGDLWPVLKTRMQQSKPAWSFAGVCVLCLFLFRMHSPYYQFSFARQDFNGETMAFYLSQGKTPVVFASRYSNGPSAFCGFDFGVAFSGKIRTEYAAVIKRYYPDCWMFKPGIAQYTNYIHSFTLSDIIARYPKILYYINPSDSTDALAEIQKLSQPADSAGSFTKCSLLYRHPRSGEQFWLVTSDTSQTANVFKPVATITSDFETLLGDSAFSTTQKRLYIGNANLRNSTQALSGKTSLAFTSREAYAGGLVLPVAKGMKYEISIWCKGNTSKRSLNIASKQLNLSSDVPVTTNSRGWQLLTLRFEIPQNFEESSVKFFLWNYDRGEEMVWWDDLEIKVYQ